MRLFAWLVCNESFSGYNDFMKSRPPLLQRIRLLRYTLPFALVLVVIGYQLGIADAVRRVYGLQIHYGVEIAFYSLAGPLVTGMTLAWIERELRSKERLENALRSIREEERARIGRDLHDGVAQTLYLLALRTDALRAGEHIPAEMMEELRQMGRMLRGSIRDIRRTIFSLRPLAWPEGEFFETLCAFVQGYAEEMGWEAKCEQDAALQVPPTLEPVIFRIVQEALNNTAKHANAGKVKVKLYPRQDAQQVVVEVMDDGQGFDVSAPPRHGLGLTQMEQRVHAAGGTFSLRSRPGEGTHVHVKLPTQ